MVAVALVVVVVFVVVVFVVVVAVVVAAVPSNVFPTRPAKVLQAPTCLALALALTVVVALRLCSELPLWASQTLTANQLENKEEMRFR